MSKNASASVSRVWVAFVVAIGAFSPGVTVGMGAEDCPSAATDIGRMCAAHGGLRGIACAGPESSRGSEECYQVQRSGRDVRLFWKGYEVLRGNPELLQGPSKDEAKK